MKKLLSTSLTAMMIFLFPLVIGAQEIVEQVYYNDGNTKSITFKSGNEMLTISYHENGNISEKAYFIDLKKDGVFYQYYEDGSVRLVAEYEEGQPKGSWKSYNQQGEMIGFATFVEGKLVNGSIWDDQGKVIASR